jgi:hypothetical protein
MPTAAAPLESAAAPAALAPAAAAAPAAGAPAAAAAPVGDAGAPAANQAFWDSWTGDDQKDVREFVANKKFADPFQLAKSYREIEQLVPTLRAAAALKGYPTETKLPDGTVKPADPAAVKAWNLATGVPETPDKYDLANIEKSPGADPLFTEELRKELHGANVPAALATKLAAGYERAVQSAMQRFQQQQDAASELAMKELERAWGSQYQERVEFARRGREFLSREVGGLSSEQLRGMEQVLGTDKFLSVMWKFGAGNGEARFAGGEGRPATFGNSVAEAQASLADLQARRVAGSVSKSQFDEQSKPLIDIITGGMKPA